MPVNLGADQTVDAYLALIIAYLASGFFSALEDPVVLNGRRWLLQWVR